MFAASLYPSTPHEIIAYTLVRGDRNRGPMILVRLSLLMLTVLGTACALSRIEGVAVPATDRWKEVVAGDRAETVSPDYPLDVTPEMVRLARDVAGRGSPSQKLTALRTYLFDPELFPFQYERSGTYTAIEAFDYKRGNCVSFTMLFIALGRAAGVNVQPALWRAVAGREKEEELIVVNNHVVAVYKSAGGVLLYDFAQARDRAPIGLRILEDNWITAMYLNNLGVEDLRQARLARARERLEMAVAMAGDFAMAFNNLGVVYRRQGDHDRALNAYALGINGWGGGSSSMDNIRLLYALESGHDQNERLPLHEDVLRGKTPEAMLRLGHAWMARGRAERALKLYDRAAKLAPVNVQAMLAKARAELYRRRSGAAIKTLSRALSLEPDHPVTMHLAALLKLQLTAAEPAREMIFQPD